MPDCRWAAEGLSRAVGEHAACVEALLTRVLHATADGAAAGIEWLWDALLSSPPQCAPQQLANLKARLYARRQQQRSHWHDIQYNPSPNPSPSPNPIPNPNPNQARHPVQVGA